MGRVVRLKFSSSSHKTASYSWHKRVLIHKTLPRSERSDRSVGVVDEVLELRKRLGRPAPQPLRPPNGVSDRLRKGVEPYGHRCSGAKSVLGHE
jgi:hypothetical protein